MTTDYKKYSLEQLSNWMHDAISAAEATPQEIYDTIKKVVEEQYYYHKHHVSQADELLKLLNGYKSVTFNLSDIPDYTDISENSLSGSYVIDPKGNAVPFSCSSDDHSKECEGAWNDFWSCDKELTEEGKELCKEYAVREQEYCDKVDKVNKWVLPVQVDGLTGECYINLPDDLLEVANLKEGDQIEYVNNNDGSFTMRKVNK